MHALVGENGAGKSTLMKTLYGMHQPDEGTIAVDGAQVTFHSPADAIAAGIGMVHQHFMLADNLTVLENIVLGAEPARGGRLDVRRRARRIDEISDAYGLDVDSDALVEDLGVGARQRVEILKVLYRGARILILDEPTAVLVPQEVDELFGNLRELKAEGLTDHLHLAQARRGARHRRRDHRDPARHDRRHAPIPADVDRPAARRDDGRLRAAVAGDCASRPSPTGSCSTVEGSAVRARRRPAPCSPTSTLTIHAGEVLGIAGVEGNGQAELVDAIMGIRPSPTGTVRLGGQDIGRPGRPGTGGRPGSASSPRTGTGRG